jgi:phospholipid/cholesterol/gamma-HCH transport system ATP-binding protein
MIRFEGVRKRLGGRWVLDGIDLEVRTGENLVVVGPSGAGKSVLLKHMVRLLTPEEGRVWVDDAVVSEASGARLERIRERFGVLFQNAALLEWLNVIENVALPLREKTRLRDEEIGRRATGMLDVVGLPEGQDKYPAELSGGMRKRVGLARALIREPEIVLYDEPTSGLDPVSARSIDELIRTLRDTLHVTGVVVTHDLHSALSVGNRIAMLHEGRIVALAPPSEFVRSTQADVVRFLESQFITRHGPWERQQP